MKDRQSLWDISVQYLGSVEGVFTLAERNSLSITGRLSDGQMLEWEIADIVNAAVQSAYAVRGIVPATDIAEAEYQELLSATSTKAGSTAQGGTSSQPDDAIVVDKIEEIIGELEAGNEVAVEGELTLTRIFEDAFDTVFT